MIPTRKKSLMMVNGFTYSQYSPMFWYCTKMRKGCRARAKTDAEGRLTSVRADHDHPPPNHYDTNSKEESDDGERLYLLAVQTEVLVLYEEAVQCLSSQSQNGRCRRSALRTGRPQPLTTENRHGCPAKAKTDAEGQLIFLREDHDHPPPKYFVTKNGEYVKTVIMIPTRKKSLMMVNGFTYSQYSPMFWYCTRKLSTACPARARTDATGALRYVQEDHNHSPPKYFVSKTGEYIKTG
ncbi:unnamed protein product [Chrysodeixis includens]|uniref:FLYWCH-type domain-containing protein n=1 Tax=Chrysodeixis includens TaxID=689277 RepID=A0A9N8KX10_CHRIL|nr:unnamed protein product [Chrysodeixis includens]